MTQPRNEYLSYSRLSRFEACPLSYKLHYLDKQTSEPGIQLKFGSAIHEVLEHLLQEFVDNETTGVLSEERAIELFREAWTKQGLTGADVFNEGLGILRRFIGDQGIVDHRAILGIEKEFRLQVGPFEVLGFIDRADQLDAETIEIIDYKSNRMLFTKDEVETSLQFSLYAAAAKVLWPWAKKFKFTFWMVRHGIKQETSRTEEQIADALLYIETLGRQTETASEFPARPNTNCSYCDHRKHCPAYAEALKGKREFICEDLADLEQVGRERAEVAQLAKTLYARQKELDEIIKGTLHENDAVTLAGVRYRMLNTASIDYPLEPTLSLLANATGREKDALLQELGEIDKKALEAVLKDLGKKAPKAQVALLKAELEAHALKSHSPRLWAKEVA